MMFASSLLAVILVGTLGLLAWLAMAERREMASTHAEIESLEARLAQIGAEQASLEGLVRRPDNAEVLERSVFLNVLLARKGISWTRIFNDLEGVMPHNVRLISVRPQLGPGNQILLDMFVGAQTAEPVIDLLKRLENSPQFGSTEVHNLLPPSQTDPLFRYRISVNYAQKF